MATTAETAEIAGSLLIDEIPVKLRCAACDKLAINAFRMPCCDQSICEECQASLPQACPVCLHEPVNKDDCRPNKALRTTIKVFLKKKGVEREGARKKELLSQAAATPSKPVTPTVEDPSSHQQTLPLIVPASESQSVATDIKQELRDTPKILNPLSSDVPQQSIESPGPPVSPKRAWSQTVVDSNLVQDVTEESQRTNKQDEVKVENMRVSQDNASSVHDNNFGFDINDAFPNMTSVGMGDLNPMMQFMPNGIPNNMMTQFPNMMGLPGMGMDPMAMSQGMFGSFGGPGMGVNGMNMGMGFDAGHNAYGGFNGQPQVFNQSQYSDHTNGMGGSFLASSGYGGNNMPQHQRSFNQMHQHQNLNNDFHHGYHSQGLYTRGRGRGRSAFFNAGRGRGYGHPASQGRQAINDQTFQSQLPEQTQRRGSPVYTPMQGSESEQQPQQIVNIEITGEVDDDKIKRRDEERIDKEFETGGAEEVARSPNACIGEDKMEMSKEQLNSEKVPSEQEPEADSILTKTDQPRPVQSVLSDDPVDATISHKLSSGPPHTTMPQPTAPSIPTGPSKPMGGVPISAPSPRGRGFGRGFVRGFPDFRSLPRGRGPIPPSDNSAQKHPASSVDPSFQGPSVSKGLGVEGAPTGPKALRQGISNVSLKIPQDAGFSIMGRASAHPRTNGSMKSPSETALRSRSSSRSRSQSLCRSLVQLDPISHRQGPRHSISPQREGKRDKRRDRHDRTSRKDDDYYEESREFKGSRTRDTSSYSSPQRPVHRSHHDYDKESSRSKHRSHRSHRNRTRSPEGASRSNRRRSRTPELRISGASRRAVDDSHHKEKDEDEGRSSRKRRERESDTRDYDRKRSRRNTDFAADDQEQGHRANHGRGEERDSRRQAKAREWQDETSAELPKGPKVDQHALEREARNRERQMKEIQRRAVMEGKTSSSRGKTNGRASERRASYKYEDEDLTARVEKERESNRWG